MVPAGSGLWALDEDGTACSADYYLRLTADGGRMLKGQLPLTPVRPTQPVVSGGGNSRVVSLRAHANAMYVCAESAAPDRQPHRDRRLGTVRSHRPRQRQRRA